jgi:high affinity Mn2+ porin
MFVTVLSIYAASTGVISCGGWMRFWLSGIAAMRHVKTFTAVLTTVLLASSLAYSQDGAPAPRPDADFSFMKMLADKGEHDIDNESWNAYGQFTYISSWKPAFNAPYTNLNGSINSLLPTAERSFTGTATLYLGVRLWKGAEGYFVPEVITEQPLSQLRGLGGAIQNFELQKGGTTVPQIYKSRLFLKQTIGLGGKSIAEDSGPLQLGTHYDSRRLVFTVGNFSILDFFDVNAFDVDPRQGFSAWGF